MTLFEEAEELARRGDAKGAQARCRLLLRSADPSAAGRVLLTLLDARAGEKLSARDFRQAWKLASRSEGTERIRLQNRLALLRPRSPLLPKAGAPRPLLTTTVAGTEYCDPEAAGAVKAGDALTLAREPENPFDRFAVRIDGADGEKLGYVPRALNPDVAALLDSGVKLKCRAVSVEAGKRAPFITVSVYE
ncbi:MAG: HIRAN domain-containing protein [Oscillospiraceae bacterium]|nr:HIRAN domain-containing protein [Oscillospiraceae bacterium]